MVHLEFQLENRPGALADLGEAMGRAGLSFEGGGMFSTGDRTIAHFLFRDGEAVAQTGLSKGFGERVLQADTFIGKGNRPP